MRERFVNDDRSRAATAMEGTAMQLEQALSARDAEDQPVAHRRDLIGPLMLAIGGGLTVAWIGFLGWGALSLTSYVLN